MEVLLLKSVLRIASWNISECVSASWDFHKGTGIIYTALDLENHISSIIDIINKQKIDIICFQEFPITISRKQVLIQRIRSETDLNYHFEKILYPGFLLDDSEIGICVFSKFPFMSADFTYLKNPNIRFVSSSGRLYYSFDKGLITVTLKPFTHDVSIISGHAISFSPFGLSELDFIDSFEGILDCCEQFDVIKERLILLGDFNTENLPAILPSLYRYMTDFIIGPTTTSGKMEGIDYGHGRKLDYCLVNQNVKVLKTEKICSFSDHVACLLECEL